MFSKKQLLSYLFLLLTIGFTSCSTSGQLTSPQIKQLPEQAENAIQAQNNFGFTLFNLVNQTDQSDENKLVSPLSVYMDLSMVYNGAHLHTKKAIQKALQLHDIDINLLNKTNAILLHNLPLADSSVNIDIANAIWYKNNLSLQSSFSKINKKYYSAKIQDAPFNTSTVESINNWVKEKTHKKIESIISQIDPSDLMYLLNAVYFKGEWTHPFDKKQTKDRNFHTSNSNQKVPFMYTKERFGYAENDSLQIAKLPYGKGNFNMYILLPKQQGNITTFAHSLNSSTFKELSSTIKKTEIKLYLPKWEASYKATLNKELTTMGMGEAFSNHADFSNIFKNQAAKISEVKHKTYIKVDEEGTEAAAVTSTGMRTTSVRIPPPSIPVMNVNHPFIYLIKEKDSGSILFLGVVNNPKER